MSTGLADQLRKLAAEARKQVPPAGATLPSPASIRAYARAEAFEQAAALADEESCSCR